MSDLVGNTEDRFCSNTAHISSVAPIKALCSERYNDWKDKLEPLGLKCMELTGDTEVDDFYRLQEVQVILTTPEKWDSMTRKWRDNAGVMQAICLFLVDEVRKNTEKKKTTLLSSCHEKTCLWGF